MDILDRIVTYTRGSVDERKRHVPLETLQLRMQDMAYHTVSLAKKTGGPHIIAEFKRKSPSRPNIDLNADPVKVATAYESGGASAISVLTEPGFFGGSPEDLRTVRRTANLPILRKDFIIDPYQIYEARLWGADLILLIARILCAEQVAEFTAIAHELGMEVLFEIHNTDELEQLGETPVDLLGVNCRDLQNFSTSLERMENIVSHLPDRMPWVAESGIGSGADVERLMKAGYRYFLVGEHLMKSADSAQALKALKAT